jgi:hypothetical protein
MATIPDVSIEYGVTDRAGRPGVAISHISPDHASAGLKATLIVQPGTGQILAWHEQTLDTTAKPQPASPSGATSPLSAANA